MGAEGARLRHASSLAGWRRRRRLARPPGHTGRMLSRELARELLGAGLRWAPTKGDRFFVPDRDLDDHVFVLSDMVIELVDVPDGSRILAFNGTTEWALDSLEAAAAV